MSSISMNPVFGDRATMMMIDTFRHGHQLAVLKGVLVALAIVGIGVFTMAMPMMGPASDAAQSVASEGRTDADAHEP